MSVIIILLLPLIAAALVNLPFKKIWAEGITVVSSAAVLVLAVRIAWTVSLGGTVTSGLNAGFLIWINVDSLSALILLLIAFVGATAAIFSFGYMTHGNYSRRKLRLYYTNYNLFVFSMLAIPVMAEPTLVWIVVELTTLASALLVSFENTREALEAAWKYVVLSLMGAAMALFGFLLLFAAMEASGSEEAYTWSGLLHAAHAMPPVLLQFAFLLILIGLGTKAGLVPMHTWLPDAHSQAPSPVCALLSGVETSVVLYVILRLFPVMQAAPGSHAETWALVLGLVSVGTAAFLLMQVSDYKRMFAYSTVEHMGIILTAVGLGASAASYGAVQQIVSHCVTKSFCFFAAGAVVLSVGTREIASVRGLVRRSPLAGAALLFGALGITGAPPLAVFLSEFSILKAGLAQKHYLATGLLAVFIVIAFFGIMLQVNGMVFGGTDDTADVPSDNRSELENKFHVPFTCRLAMIMAAVPVVALGLYIPGPLQELLTRAAGVLTR
jgi:hydrogenase-4 component F